MDDLKLIDELLVLLRPSDMSWSEFECEHSFVVLVAMRRLRQAWAGGEMKLITGSISNHFEADPTGPVLLEEESNGADSPVQREDQ